jgi:hypothetical protein
MPGGPRMNNPSANMFLKSREEFVVKETRSIRCSLPFSRIPALLMVNIVVYMLQRCLRFYYERRRIRQ